MRRPRDSQRQKVYDWERNNVSGFREGISLDECRKFAARVCRDSHFMADVTDGRGRRSACAYSHRICLPTGCRTKAIVLHELAHCMLQQYSDYHAYAGHGPEFVRVYMWLLQRYHKQSLRTLRATAKLCRVKYAPPSVVYNVRAILEVTR